MSVDTPPGWTPEYSSVFQIVDLREKDVSGKTMPRDTRDWNVPIKLDISQEQRVLKDTLTWNCRPGGTGPLLTVEAFAKQLVDDSDLPESFISAIISQMNAQINDAIE